MRGRIDRPSRSGWVSLLAVATLLAGSGTAALAQDASEEVRLRKIESEVRALQRKVFPGGDERYFKPEVSTSPTGAPGVAAPTTSAVTDILTRMDAIEAQLARLTGQVEENVNRIGVLEARAGIFRPGAAGVPTTTVAPATGAVVLPTQPAITAPRPAAPVNLDTVTATPAVRPAATTPAITTPPSSRVAAVRAIEKPQTSDPADDEYSYGYRLWEAGFYPEARQQLKMFVDKYPRHQRVSYGRNLLGRSFLDDGQPAEAAKWFLENYQTDKSGARAPDSLLYLAGSMEKMKDDKRACIALAEFSVAYAAEAAGRLKGQYDDTRRGLSCPG